MTWQTRLGVLAFAVVLLPGRADGQGPAKSWDDLKDADWLARGDGVHLTDSTGRRVTGTIEDISSTGLTMTHGHEIWTLRAPEITRIERQDPLWTGAAIGAGIRYGALVAYCLRGDYSGCAAAGAAAYPFVAATAALGILWDLATHKTLYEAPGDAQVSVVPMQREEQVGVQLSVTW